MAPGRSCSPVAPLSPHSSEPAHKYQLHDVIRNQPFLKNNQFSSITFGQLLISHQLSAIILTHKAVRSSSDRQRDGHNGHGFSSPRKNTSTGTVSSPHPPQRTFPFRSGWGWLDRPNFSPPSSPKFISNNLTARTPAVAAVPHECACAGGCGLGWGRVNKWKRWEHPLSTYDVKGISTDIFLGSWQSPIYHNNKAVGKIARIILFSVKHVSAYVQRCGC